MGWAQALPVSTLSYQGGIPVGESMIDPSDGRFYGGQTMDEAKDPKVMRNGIQSTLAIIDTCRWEDGS